MGHKFKLAALLPLVGSPATVDLSLYTDPTCQSVKRENFQHWDVSATGCCTVRSANGTTYVQFACVDKGVFQLVYPNAGCRGKLKAKIPKTWHWWLSMVEGKCTFDHLEAAYFQFDSAPRFEITSRVGHCDVEFTTEKYEYRDPHCREVVGEVQELNYARSGCLDVTGTGSEGSGSYRAGTKFTCSGSHLLHESFDDYYYCSGTSYRKTMHTESWFQAYSAGWCVKDLHSKYYFKLTSPMPPAWTAAVTHCASNAVARLSAYGGSTCGVDFNASGALDWEAVDEDGCITVVETSMTMPLYKQIFRCVNTGASKHISMEVYSGHSCRAAPPFFSPLLQHNISLATWEKLLQGECFQGGPWTANHMKLVGLSSSNLAKVRSASLDCMEDAAIEELTEAQATTSQTTTSEHFANILHVDAAARPFSAISLLASSAIAVGIIQIL